MPQKIDIHGLFIDPETITDLRLQKRISVSYPVFHEVQTGKSVTRSVMGLFSSELKQHILQFDQHMPYGIILADIEQPDPASYVMTYREAAIERFLRGIGHAGKSLAGHFQECLQIDVSGDREYRILQSGRNVKQTSIREIPAKVRLLNGQWVDVFKSTPGYDFQGGTPYAITDVASAALLIATNEQVYVLFGAGVDASDAEVTTSYQQLIGIYNQIQARRDAAAEEKKGRPLFQLPQINIQLPTLELPKIEIPQIRFQSPFVFGKKKEEPATEASQAPEADEASEGEKDLPLN